MTNLNFLSNRSGFAPDLTTRQSRSVSVSLASRLRVLVILLLCLTVGVGQMWGDDVKFYTLTPAATGDNASPHNVYGSAATFSCTDNEHTIGWSVTGNSYMVPWRIGGKGGSKSSSTSDYTRTVYTTTAIEENVTKIDITHGTSNLNALTTMTVTVSTAQNGGGTVRHTFTLNSSSTPKFAASTTITLERPGAEDWSNCYYLISYTVRAKGTSNQYLQFSKVEFYEEGASCTKIDAPSVTATPGDRQISLSWANQAEASSYTVTCTGGTPGAVTGTTTKSCTITGLTNGTSYTWAVTPVGDDSPYCASGNTAASASATPNVYYTVTWNNHGSTSTSSVVSGNKPTFPATPSSCDLTCTTFYGWSTSAWSGSITSLAGKTIYTKASDMPNVTGDVTYYAVYSDGLITEYTFTSSSWNATSGGADANWTSGSAGAGYTAGQGVQVTTAYTGANATSPVSFSNVNKVVVTYNTNKTSGTGSIGIKIGSNAEVTNAVAYDSGISDDGRSADFTTEYTFSPVQTGNIKLTANTTTNSIWPKSIEIHSGAATPHYLTTCCTPLASINGSFSFSNVSPTSVTVGVPSDYSDKDNANLEGYIFKRYTASTGGSAVETKETNSSSGTTATFNTGLVANTTYYYTIIAKHSSSSCNSAETSPRKSHTITSYTVSYAAGDGDGTNPGAHAPVLSGTSIDLKDNTFTAPAGKEFAGWNDGSNDYDEGDSYTVTANKTMTAQWSCITPAISSSSISNASYSIGDTPADLSVTASGGTLSYEWKQCATENGTYVTVTGGTGGNTDTYTPPTSAASDLWYQCTVTNTGSSCNTTATSGKAHIIVSAPSYRLWTAWANGNDCDGDICNTWNWTGGSYFVNYNSTNEWRISNFTIPDFEWDAVNQRQMIYNVAGKNATNTKFYDLALAVSQGSGSVKKGPMPGAVGTLRMYDNYGDPNGYLGFLPNNYMVRFGTHDYIMTETSSTVWETAIQTLAAADLTNESQYRVGVTNSSDEFVAINENCPLTNVTSMGQKSNAGNSWGSNLASGDADKRGKFRIWLDNATANWTCHFVPYHRIVFKANYPVGAIGDEPADTYSVDVSVEETNSSISLASAPTAPAGYTFAGWFTDASGGTQRTGAQTISAGATADVTLYAHWTANANTAYTVKHYQQNIADNNYTLFATQNLTGTTDAEVTPAVNSYTGFTAPSTQTVTILGDGSRVVEYNYTRNSYSLTWNLGGGTTTSAGTGIESGVSVNTTSSVKYGTSLTAPTVTKTGYGFNAWSSEVAGTMPAAATTYTATWNATNYTITYNDLEGATNSNPANYTIESSAITLLDPGTREGYTFAGWYTNAGKTTPASTPAIAAGSTGNKTFWAKWSRNYYTVTWHVGDATDTSDDVEHGTLFSALDPESDAPAHADNALSACGSTKFIGWVKASGAYTDDGKTVDWYNTHKANASDAITDNTDYYAMYAEASGSSTDYTLYSGILTEGDYVLVYATTGSALKNTVTSNRLDYEEPSIVTDVISSPAASIIWHIAQDGDYWTIYNDNVSKYAGGTTTKNQGALLSSVTDYAKWSCSSTAESTTYDFINKGRAGGASDTGNKYLRNNKSGNPATNYGFACYASGTGGALSLYKLSVSYINYRTGCSVSCGMPTSLTNTSVGKAGATIGWTGGGNGTLVRYEYAVWEDGTVEPTSDYISAGTSTSATLSGLYSGVKYNWKVRKVCTGDDNSRFATSNFTTTAADLTFSVPTGATPVDGQSCTAALPSAGVPTDCGSCWAFVGWTTATYPASSSAPGTLYFEGDIVKVSGDATLYAVYQNSKYKRISSTDDLVTNNNYVIGQMPSSTMYALSNTPQASYENDAAVTDVTSNMETVGDDKFIKNVGLNNIWKFTGTYSSGQLYNAASGKYLNLTSQDNSVLNTTDNLTFAVSEELWTINSTYYLGGYESPSVGFDAVDAATLASDRNKSYLYRQLSCTFATTPDCPKYTVTWDVNNGATTSTSNVTKCAGYLASLPGNPSNTTLSSCQTNGKFMGWSPTKVMPAQDVVPTGMFNDVAYAPEITRDTTFYAVFAEEHSGATGATNRTYTFTSGAWGDDESAWSSGSDGGWYNSAVQVSTGKSGANATTKSSYDDVTKVTVTYFTNGSAGAGTITIEVGGTAYTGSASVTSTGGTTPRTIDFTPPSTALDGAVKITVTCSTNSIYIKSVQIFYTGSKTTYDQYRTACCNDPQLKFLDGEGDPTTEYVIVREDLASASTPVEIDCDISSLNTTEDITWKQTKRIKTDYHTANTWNASQTDRCQIDITNHKISAYETGSWQITIEQLMGSTNYCDGTATVNILVKTIDKFIDAVNGNFSGEPQSLEDTGNGILLPTEAMFSTNNGCSTTRRLIGWIKASDIATYASSRRVDMIDDLKTSDPATNKVIAPGTKVQATGVTWYAVWGVEK